MSADKNENPLAAEILRDTLIRAPRHQGGHSDVGRRMAALLGIPFPIRMEALHKRALELGENPHVLWPWYEPKMQNTQKEQQGNE